MAFLLRLIPWVRLRPPPAGAASAPAPPSPCAPVPVDEAAALDAEVMRRRVQHFCEECPPPSRTRR